MTPEELCRQCGLCCDGSLFSVVPLQEDEAARVPGLSLPVVRRADGSAAIEQRCAAFCGDGCSVYAHRPSACRRFNCRQVTALSEGEVSFAEAADLVTRARALIAELAALLPGTANGQALASARRTLSAGGSLPDAADAAWDRAERFLDQHFRHARSRVRPL